MTEFNWVDLVIATLVLVAAVRGYQQGAALQVFSYVGFGLGLWVGAKLGPFLSQFVGSPFLRIGVVVLAVFGTASVLSAVGKVIGARATRSVPGESALGIANSAGGVLVGVLATLLAVWLVGGMLAQVGLGQMSTSFQQSRSLRALTDRLPPAPSVFSRIQRTLLPSGFPAVFAELEPSPAPAVANAGNVDVDAVAAASRESVVKISAAGCGRLTSGSGFVAAPDLVVTNAHVVAGVDRPVVEDGAGDHRTTVVLFDPDMDLAVLRTGGLEGSPLPMLRSEAGRGQEGAVLGFPGGGPFAAQAGVVRDLFPDAVGRDIYSRDLVSRDVYQLDARVRSGNSGGPFVAPSGQVVGVVFASSLVNPQIAYSLTSSDVAGRVDQVLSATGAVDTGPCPR